VTLSNGDGSYMTRIERRTFLGISMACAAFPGAAREAWSAVEVPANALKRGGISIRGKDIAYRAEAAEIVIRDSAGVPRATMFAVSYLAERAQMTKRPVTFIWNGGPGGASFSLREQLGPRCTEAAERDPGYAFRDNADSLVDVTDLVFIDAPGTGYSRLLEEGARSEFWGIEQDGRAFAQFIVEWLRIHKREGSPKYLMGESYGGTRVAQVAKNLATRMDPFALTGIVLISPAFSNDGLDARKVAALALPTQAALAWAYGRGGYTSMALEEVVSSARAFAYGPLSDALSEGGRLSNPLKVKIADQVAAYIGLCRDLVLDADLTLRIDKFSDLLLAEQGERLDSYDGRKHHPRPPPDAPEPSYRISGPPPEALIREELGYRPVIPYQRDYEPIIKAWNKTLTSEPSAEPTIIKDLMSADAGLKLLMVGGYFDLAVPCARPLASVLAAKLPEARFRSQFYPVGHSVYADKALRPQTTDDLRAFYRRAVT
jgi:carboxypeptidase C (cathepsin A)